MQKKNIKVDQHCHERNKMLTLLELTIFTSTPLTAGVAIFSDSYLRLKKYIKRFPSVTSLGLLTE